MQLFKKKFSFVIYILIHFNNVIYSQNAPELLSGFPIVIDSAYFGKTHAVVSDINNDGTEEIIVAKNSNPFLMFVYKIDGTVLEGWPQPYTTGEGILSIAAGDIDGDGIIEIVARDFLRLFVWHSNGIIVQGYPKTLASAPDNNFYKSILLCDLHNNNTLDIITTTFNQITVHHFDGTLHIGWPKILNGTRAMFPIAADFDRNGTIEILVSSYSSSIPMSGWLYLFNSDGDLVPHWPLMLDSGYYCNLSPSICNILENDSLEIVVPASKYINTNPPSFESKILVISPSARVIKQWYSPLPLGDWKDFSTPSYTDINDDGFNEIVVSDWEYNTYIYDTLWNILPGWPKHIAAQVYTPILADITNDSIPELFVGNYESTRDTGIMHCFNYLGQEMPWSPFRVLGNTGTNYPIFSDMNGDGTIEMVLLGSLGIRYNGYALSVYRFPNTTFSTTTSPWPQLQHDRHNTYQFGYIPSDNIVGVANYVASVPEQFSLKQNYPNPFNPQTTIGFLLLANRNVTLKVYNLLGQEVATLISNETRQTGKHEVQFDGSKLPGGIYFYRLNVDGKISETKKLVLMK